MRSLRVAHVTEYYYPHVGGVSEHVRFLARESRRRGHHVDVITSHMDGAPADPHVIRLGRGQPVYANGSMARVAVGRGLRRQMREVLRRGSYDVVHVHAPLTPVLPLLAVEEAECKVVGTFHTYFDSCWSYGAARRYFQRRLDRLDAAIAVSASAVDAHARYFDADWTVIPNGVDPDLFTPAAPPAAGMRRDGPVVLFLGRLDPRNGLAALIDAFRQVRGPRRPAQLVVAGDGPLRRYYEHLAAGDPDVTFVGSVFASRPGYYANSAVYACPTTKASFGITLLEAMACATPIVCSDIVGFRNVVAPGREALMVPPRDAGALADALVRVLDDDALRRRLGQAGLQRAQHYAWPRVATAVLDSYARVLGQSRPGRAATREVAAL